MNQPGMLTASENSLVDTTAQMCITRKSNKQYAELRARALKKDLLAKLKPNAEKILLSFYLICSFKKQML